MKSKNEPILWLLLRQRGQLSTHKWGVYLSFGGSKHSIYGRLTAFQSLYNTCQFEFFSQNRHIACRQQYQFESNLGKQKRYTYTRIFHRHLLNRSMDPGLIGGYCRFIFITKNSRARKHCPIWSYTAINFIHSDQKKKNKTKNTYWGLSKDI